VVLDVVTKMPKVRKPTSVVSRVGATPMMIDEAPIVPTVEEPNYSDSDNDGA